MLNDPMLIAEMIAEKRDAEDEAWRAKYADLKAREAWHETPSHEHSGPFAECPWDVCRGLQSVPYCNCDRPVPR